MTYNNVSVLADEFELSDEDLVQAATDALKRPSESAWYDSDLFVTHTLMFSTPAWSLTDDYMVDQANYRAVLRDMSEKYENDVEAATFGHWTYSRFEAIKVRVVDESGDITKAFAEMVSIAKHIAEQDPIYDEGLHYELESEVFDRNMDYLLSDIERDSDTELSDKWRETFKSALREVSSSSDDISNDDIEWAKEIANSER